MAFGALGTIGETRRAIRDAGRLYEESLETLRELGNRRNEFGALRYQGILSLDEGHPDEAVTRLERAAAIARRSANLVVPPAAPLGAALATLGRLDESAAAFQAAAESLGASGDKRQMRSRPSTRACSMSRAPRGRPPRGGFGRRSSSRRCARAWSPGTGSRGAGTLDGRLARRLLEAALAVVGRRRRYADHPERDARSDARAWPRNGRSPDRAASAWTQGAARYASCCSTSRSSETPSPGVGISMHALVDAGWPGERIQPEAAAARVYTSIKTLRALGLDAIVIRRDDGYLINPDTSVIRRPR